MINKILFLRSNPVDPDSRVEKEVNSLVKAGYEVNILAWDRSNRYKVKKSPLNLESGTASIYRFGIPATFGEGFKNLKGFTLFQIHLFVWMIKNREKYSVIHACDFDTAFTAYPCAKLLKKKFIFDIFDYLFTNTGGRYSIFRILINKLQHNIINGAHATIICTEQRKKQIKGSSPKKVVVIHNSPPPIDDHLPNNSPRQKSKDEKVKIVYVGILQDHRLLKEMTRAIVNMNNCELHIGGFGKYENFFKKYAKNFNNIFYYGKLSYKDTLALEKGCDIITAIYDPCIGNHYFAAPNKFYEALMLGKPLIMVRNTGMSDIVKRHNLGEIISYNEESFAKAVHELVEKRNLWPEISGRMKEIYTNEYSWWEMEKRLIKLYQDL